MMGLPMMITASVTPSGPSQVVEPDVITFLESHRISHAVIVGLHMVTGNLQVLQGVVIYVMQLLHEVSCVVDCRLLPIWRSPKQQVSGQAKHPHEHHVGWCHACGLISQCSIG
jgi:hypothetical protein